MFNERFLDKIIYSENGHWLWSGAINSAGYGGFGLNGKIVTPHKYAWEQVNGIVPDGICVLHKNFCHIRHCVNPDHLYLGTHSDNMKDKRETKTDFNVNKTHCPQGHPYSEENTYRYQSERQCRECNKARCLKYYYKKQAA